QRVALDGGLGVAGAFLYLDQAAVGGPAAGPGHRLGDDLGRRVGRAVHHLRARVLVLAGPGERDRQGLALGVLAHQVDRRVLHGDLGADVAVDPFHARPGLDHGPLGHQVVDVARPVLDGRVAAVRAGLDDDLDHRGVQRVGGVDRRGAAFHVVDGGALVDDDQRPLELAHVLGVDPEVCLQVHVYGNALRRLYE